MRKSITIAVILLTLSAGGVMASADELKSTALRAVDLLFLKGDKEAFLKLVAADAERKTRGAGSAVESIQRLDPGVFTGVALRQVLFAGPESIPDLKEAYPDDMWEEVRVPAHLGDGLGCLVLIDAGGKGRGMMFFVLKDLEGECLITYLDDN